MFAVGVYSAHNLLSTKNCQNQLLDAGVIANYYRHRQLRRIWWSLDSNSLAALVYAIV